METGLRRLRYFRILAATLNFRRAAVALGITQPALSRAISQLEEEVGAALFTRSNRQVALTAAGQSFLKGCARTLDALETAIDETRRVSRGLSGTLTIGYTDTVIAGRLPDVIEGFCRIAPDVTIRLVQGYTDQQMEMMEAGQLDVAIVTSPGRQLDLETLPLQSDGFMALLPASHELAKSPRIMLRDLALQAFVMGDPDRWAVYNRHLWRYCERAGFDPSVVQTAPESRAIIGLVSCGLGVSIMPESLVSTVDARVVARPIADLETRLESFACWRLAEPSAVLVNFCDFLASTYGTDDPSNHGAGQIHR
ncbi:LysR family transcriptional regulator [Jannaschia sp. S6380]|uniref:LysR family transcriptional regulator n=1 Tax=Jannaschia sp. S6380 TaxID=2926408 RepID=UPI001FF1275B|nr:LysR family transcriptional regulator [Jannaschia sp. S6380]MCK0168857.1 LysR family transcriptional regulator [Jannaschia sp. S6380]